MFYYPIVYLTQALAKKSYIDASRKTDCVRPSNEKYVPYFAPHTSTQMGKTVLDKA